MSEREKIDESRFLLFRLLYVQYIVNLKILLVAFLYTLFRKVEVEVQRLCDVRVFSVKMGVVEPTVVAFREGFCCEYLDKR